MTTDYNTALPYNFSISGLISESWQRVSGMKAPVWCALFFYILITISIFIAISAVNHYLLMFHGHKINIIMDYIVRKFILIFTVFPMSIGFSYLGMRRSVDLPLRAKQIFHMYRFYWRIIGLIFLQTLIVFGSGVILGLSCVLTHNHAIFPRALVIIMNVMQLLFPIFVLYVIFSFFFAYLLIVDKNLGVFKAFKASFLAFKQHGFKIIFAYIAMFFILLLSAIPLGIGLIWTYPMLLNFKGILYRTAFGVKELA